MPSMLAEQFWYVAIILCQDCTFTITMQIQLISGHNEKETQLVSSRHKQPKLHVSTCHNVLWMEKTSATLALGDTSTTMMYFMLTALRILGTLADEIIWHLLHVYYSNQVSPLFRPATEGSVYWFSVWCRLLLLSSFFSGLDGGWVTRHWVKWLRSYWQISLRCSFVN